MCVSTNEVSLKSLTIIKHDPVFLLPVLFLFSFIYLFRYEIKPK